MRPCCLALSRIEFIAEVSSCSILAPSALTCMVMSTLIGSSRMSPVTEREPFPRHASLCAGLEDPRQRRSAPLALSSVFGDRRLNDLLTGRTGDRTGGVSQPVLVRFASALHGV